VHISKGGFGNSDQFFGWHSWRFLLLVLTKIRKLIFDFLWMGGRKEHGIHLCSWEKIAKPKLLGGWGLRNLFIFNRALATKSLWQVLMEEGIWHRVIKYKYLPYTFVAT
jgi:hypothetical protein